VHLELTPHRGQQHVQHALKANIRQLARIPALRVQLATSVVTHLSLQLPVLRAPIAQARLSLVPLVTLDITRRLHAAAAVPHVLLALNVATLRLRRCNVRPARIVQELLLRALPVLQARIQVLARLPARHVQLVKSARTRPHRRIVRPARTVWDL